MLSARKKTIVGDVNRTQTLLEERTKQNKGNRIKVEHVLIFFGGGAERRFRKGRAVLVEAMTPAVKSQIFKE